ncbi:MAG: hypothetical protein A2365_02510 [Candidatus Nealsonbacteria bacterium RIFOXYB1_FULL_40_15]|uniref:Carrier domain-containing protein n=2 Tax=Candidatus Nealsoniibacteriota TaxID=1817911 RepID=A0A1G2ET37_9BACT|nr:MAG: hypothetical protein A2365_02510 [Candidatus Nealsonbacteria bacterium RIFOXYB1_FULL_40_15]OGZ28510.1 MAG: hypothetical protein A2427_02165 [Candidatus Nealsonbacteria bacterium RIFOXYC1_FULL_40_7]OGZ28702.1 MAG: hypothetical protein A2562_00640 [Candidatus Nealsonbacteria bacterium RIFOXYD1_FULL_39_11]
MTRQEIEEHLRTYLKTEQGVNEAVTEKTLLSDLLDSLSVIETITDLEDRFGIDISDEKMAEIKTVGQAIDYLYLLLNPE